MRFTKMHGIGNDYIYVNCFEEPFPTDPAELARKMADRHFGIGGDGLILICKSDAGADARMRMYNADGSEAEMCGNGLRCVAKYVYDHGIKRAETLRIQTGRGTLTVDLELKGGKVDSARVNMGQPILEAAQIPARLPGVEPTDHIVDYRFGCTTIELESGRQQLDNAQVEGSMTCVSTGNPHVVFFCKQVQAVPLAQVGPLLEHHEMFPKRINVHFVQIHSPEEVTMRTWERGSGITLACGTGACAVCVAGALSGRSHRRITAHLPGGDLELEWREADNCVYMTGPATEVFTGDWPN
jgi:diaminopimelate epimerase